MSIEPVRRAARSGARPLRLAPFRALRYNPERAPDLGAVTCPPYDVIGADRVIHWEAAEPHNVVRLILPRDGTTDDRHAHAGRDLRRWLADGVLVQDATPALYVYEQSAGAELSVGLVGAISLHDYDERRILPHEDVFPGPVADRTELMAATAAQLEPILLTYEGDGPASDVVDTLLGEPPMVEAHADGTRHRLWRVSEPAALRTIGRDLAGRRALIADGHHRYAAYLALRDRWANRGATGADAAFGLAMLVDARRHPLRLGAIHRSVAGLNWRDAVDTARRAFRTVQMLPAADAPAVAAELAEAQTRHSAPAFAVTDGSGAAALLSNPDPVAVRDSMPAGSSELWRNLSASIARELLLGRLWGVDDADPEVSYHHLAADATGRAAATGGTAVLLNPAELADVMALAARGERMPRKSTSFGPKPRTGLLMRLLGDDASTLDQDAVGSTESAESFGSAGSIGSTGGR